VVDREGGVRVPRSTHHEIAEVVSEG
jgi:hypothetical protein